MVFLQTIFEKLWKYNICMVFFLNILASAIDRSRYSLLCTTKSLSTIIDEKKFFLTSPCPTFCRLNFPQCKCVPHCTLFTVHYDSCSDTTASKQIRVFRNLQCNMYDKYFQLETLNHEISWNLQVNIIKQRFLMWLRALTTAL